VAHATLEADMQDLMYFTPAQTRNLARLTTRQLHYWEQRGIVRPAKKVGKGFATRRLYSYTNLVELRTARRLLDVGLSLQSIRKALDVLRRIMKNREDVSMRMLAFDGKTIVVKIDDGTVDLLRGGQYVMVMHLAPIVDDLTTAITSMQKPVREAA
jgi:DNA-binding transcriptional MerR regulator